jgi:hypothetical protein
VAAIGGGLAPALIGLGLSAYLTSKFMNATGIGAGIGETLKKSPTMQAVAKGMITKGGAETASAYKDIAQYGRGAQRGFIAGKVASTGLSLAAAGLKFALLTAPTLGMEALMTGGLSLIPRGVQGARKGAAGIRNAGKSLIAFDDTMKGTSTPAQKDGTEAVGTAAAGAAAVAAATVSDAVEEKADDKGESQPSEAKKEDAESIQTEASEDRAPGGSGTESLNPEEAPSAADTGKPSEGEPSAQPSEAKGATGTATSSESQSGSGKTQEEQAAFEKWEGVKDVMLDYTRGSHRRREKGTGEQLEEMMEDRDERPSR